MFHYLVIGGGSIGKRHFKNFQDIGVESTLIHYRDLDLRKLKKFAKEKKSHLGILVATETNIRWEIINELKKFDASFYIEKPLTFDKKVFQKIYALPKELLDRSMVGFMMRYHPLVKDLISLRINNFTTAKFEIKHDVKKWRKNWNFKNSYASKKEGGGVLLDLCHEIDIANLICKSLTISSIHSFDHKDFKDVDIKTDVKFLSEERSSCKVEMDYLSPNLIRRGHIKGNDYCLDYDLVKGKILYNDKGKSFQKSYSADRNQMFRDILEDFVKLTEGYAVSNKNIPSLTSTKEVNFLIQRAWENRKFLGQEDFDLS